MKKKRILVTGGDGFLGKFLVKKLKEKSYDVSVFDLSRGNDILDKSQLEKATQNIETVFHLAAVADLNNSRKSPLKNMEVNIDGTINVAEACLKNDADLFFASTCCAYGNPKEHPVTEETLPNPTEIYACSKLAGEYVIKGYANTCGLKYNILRLATFYGPKMRSALAVSVFLNQAMRGEPITIHGDGKQTRTMTYIDDIVDGLVSCLESGVKNETINITTEEEVSVLEMVKIIKEITNSSSKLKFINQRPGQIIREEILAKKAKKLFGWEAKVSFREGVRRSYEWLKLQ